MSANICVAGYSISLESDSFSKEMLIHAANELGIKVSNAVYSKGVDLFDNLNEWVLHQDTSGVLGLVYGVYYEYDPNGCQVSLPFNFYNKNKHYWYNDQIEVLFRHLEYTDSNFNYYHRIQAFFIHYYNGGDMPSIFKSEDIVFLNEEEQLTNKFINIVKDKVNITENELLTIKEEFYNIIKIK